MINQQKESKKMHSTNYRRFKGEIENYVLENVLGNSAWTSEDAVISDFEPVYGDAIYAQKKLLSPTQLKKVVGTEQLTDYIHRPKSGVKLVQKEKSKNPLTVKSAKDDFEELTK